MGLFNKKELEEIARLRKEIERLSNENKKLNTELIHSKKTINEINDGVNKEINEKIMKVKEEEKIINERIKEKKSIMSNLEIEIGATRTCLEDYEQLRDKAIKDFSKNCNKAEKLEGEISELEKQLEEMIKREEDSMKLIDMNAFEFSYHFEDSSKYEEKLKLIKDKQKAMMSYDPDACVQFVKYGCLGGAVEHFFIEWMYTWDSSKEKKQDRQRRNIDRLLVRAFNNECDNIIANVKYSNIGISSDKIKKSFETMNKFTKMLGTKLTENYLSLKLEELELRCGYITMKQMEKEEQQRIREQMKEEERVRKELEAEEKKVEKEEQHFMNELNKLQKRMAKENEENQAKLLKQIEELQAKLSEVSETKADLMNRKMNNKAGYVYIISNKGSFGENVYKIGTTRRLDPQVRVDELSNASVPFKYDVHAMIFTDDAFELENNLHKIFDDKRVNKVNKHKEFFNVTIDEIEKAVKENFNETVEFNKTILNEEYLLSISLEK